MLKREVLQQYEYQICEAQAEIDEDLLPEIEGLEYELEIVRRVAERSEGTSEEEDRQIQVRTLEMLIAKKRGRLEELRAEINRNETVFAEIERDIEDGAIAASGAG